MKINDKHGKIYEQFGDLSGGDVCKMGLTYFMILDDCQSKYNAVDLGNGHLCHIISTEVVEGVNCELLVR